MRQYKTPRGKPKTHYVIKIFDTGIKEYFMNMYRHRIDGPAIEDPEGVESSWWIGGEIVDCFSQTEFESSKEFREWKLKVFS